MKRVLKTRSLGSRRALLAAAPFWLAAAASQGLDAATYNVAAGNASDLRAKINLVNASTENDTIVLPAGTYVLSGAPGDNANISGDLDITKSVGNLTILGAGRGVTVLRCTTDRVFHFTSGAGITITIQDLSIDDGSVFDDGVGLSAAMGGAILNRRVSSGANNTNLTLRNVDVANCLAMGSTGPVPGAAGSPARGGAIYSAGGTLTIDNCNLTDNMALGGDGASGTTPGPLHGGAGGAGQGGAIYVAGGNLLLTASSISENQAMGGIGATGSAGGNGGNGGNGQGGAIYFAAGTLTMNTSSLSNNTAEGGKGGDGASGSTSFQAAGGDGGSGGDGQGGAIFVAGGTVTINSGCSLSLNEAVGAWSDAWGGDGTAGLNGGANNGGAGGSGGNGRGGALYVDGGNVTLTRADISANAARGGMGDLGGNGSEMSNSGGQGGQGGRGGDAEGGAVYARLGATTLTECRVNGNTCTGGESFNHPFTGTNGGQGGRGAVARGGEGGNAGPGGSARGGGVYAHQGSVIMQLERCAVTNNTCYGGLGGGGGDGGMGAAQRGGHGGSGGAGGDALGGGYYRNGGSQTLWILNTTVSGNSTHAGGGGGGGTGGTGSPQGNGGAGGNTGQSAGGGISIAGGTLQVFNSTVAGNNALNTATPGSGGSGASTGASGLAPGTMGGGARRGAGTLEASSTIFADNSADGGADISGTVTANYCVIETTGGASITGSNNLNADPQLSALADNGGPTLTHAIAPASIARDAGAANGLATDQRGSGYARDDGGGVDIGAFEFQAAGALTPPVISTPSAAVITNSSSLTIEGTAPANSLVRIYLDAGNDGSTAGDQVAGTQQLAGGATTFSITVNLPLNAMSHYLATADIGGTESAPAGVPPVTHDNIAPPSPVVTDPSAALSMTGTAYDIQGTAAAGSLVRIYIDYNNNGVIDGSDVEITSQQLSVAATAFSINTPIILSTANHFLVTALDAAGNESIPADVPTITETTPPAVAQPVVTSPAAATNTTAATYLVGGTAPAGTLVRLYTDLNNDGFVNGADSLVGQAQLTPGQTAFNVMAPLVANQANNFTVTAFDGTSESLPSDVPTITQVPAVSGGKGGKDGGGGCSTGRGPLALFAMLLAPVALLLRRRKHRT